MYPEISVCADSKICSVEEGFEAKICLSSIYLSEINKMTQETEKILNIWYGELINHAIYFQENWAKYMSELSKM